MTTPRRLARVALAAVVGCSPKSRVAERYPTEETPTVAFPAPTGGGARLFVVSRGVRWERVRDGFGCVSGEMPGVDILPARNRAAWRAEHVIRFDGRPAPAEPTRVLPPRSPAVGMFSRAEAVRAATDGEVQACWSPDGTRFVWRAFHPAAVGRQNWTRVEWTPAPVLVRSVPGSLDCVAALHAAPAL